jgi:nucleoside-diphosphate-sugar epimerase
MFILASTSSIYSSDAPLSFSETATSKKGAEGIGYAYHFLHGSDITIFRYFTAFDTVGCSDKVWLWYTERLSFGLNGDLPLLLGS